MVGAESVGRGEVTVSFAQLERVMIDAAGHPAWFSGISEVARIMRRGFARADADTLVGLAQHWREASLLQRLGWWAEREGSTAADTLFQAWSKRGRSRQRAPLLAGGTRKGHADQRWRVFVNVPQAALRDEDGPA